MLWPASRQDRIRCRLSAWLSRGRMCGRRCATKSATSGRRLARKWLNALLAIAVRLGKRCSRRGGQAMSSPEQAAQDRRSKALIVACADERCSHHVPSPAACGCAARFQRAAAILRQASGEISMLVERKHSCVHWQRVS